VTSWSRDVKQQEDEGDRAGYADACPSTWFPAGDITHDFMMLNPLSDTHATRAAIAQAIAALRDALNTA
jgi:hypothetical protein